MLAISQIYRGALPLYQLQKDYYQEAPLMRLRVGPSKDDVARLQLQTVNRNLFTGTTTALGTAIMLQSRSEREGVCKGNFGTWLVDAVNKLWEGVCEKIEAHIIGTCRAENSVVTSCSTTDAPTTFFGEGLHTFQGKHVFVETLQAITMRPILLRKKDRFSENEIYFT